MKTVIKRFDLNAAEEDTVSKQFELDKTIKAIKGILITSDKDDLLYYRGSQRIEINGEEIFPESYESKLLMSGINVAPNKRYYDLGNINPGNGIVKMAYADFADGRTDFEDYRVSLYLNCDMEEEK